MRQTTRKSKRQPRPVAVDFMRWGALRPQYHEIDPEDCEDRWFHEAPTHWGFYAFPRLHVSFDLLAVSNQSRLYETNRIRWLRDERGQRIPFEDWLGPYFGAMTTKRFHRICRINGIRYKQPCIMRWREFGGKNSGLAYYWGEPRCFSYSGLVWHHLENFYYTLIDPQDGSNGDIRSIRLVRQADVLDRSGSWVKTTMRVYREALRRHEACVRHYHKAQPTASPAVHERRQRTECSANIEVEAEHYYEVFIERV